ncbi:hydroxyacid dehydrogenase [Mariniluteicoccus flavus]
MTDDPGHPPRTRPRILLAVLPDQVDDFLGDDQLARLGELGELTVWDDPDDWANAPGLAETEVVVTGWMTPRLTPEVLERAPRLGAIVHCGGSVRFLVDPAAYDRDIVVSSQAVANAQPVAQHAIATIMLALKDAFALREDYRRTRGRWDREAAIRGIGVAGRTVGIVGCSTIGRLVVDGLRGLPLQVRAYDPTLADDDPVFETAERDTSLVELFSRSHVVSLHAPLLDATRRMVDATALAAMPDGATLVNTARGGVVDEGALITELATGRVRAVLDVTVDEPPPANSPLWDLSNAFLTPHIAGAGGHELRVLGAGAVDEVERWVTGRPLQNLVTHEDYVRRA